MPQQKPDSPLHDLFGKDAPQPAGGEVVQVLTPVGLDLSYSYRVPRGLDVRPGSIVQVPLGPRKVVGVVNDVTPEVVAGLKEGTLYGTSEQNFCGMATGAVEAIVALSKGETVEKVIDTGITFITLENLDAESQK